MYYCLYYHNNNSNNNNSSNHQWPMIEVEKSMQFNSIDYDFVPVAIETLGSFSSEAHTRSWVIALETRPWTLTLTIPYTSVSVLQYRGAM